MGAIEVYTFEDREGHEQSFTTQNPTEAAAHGERHGLRVISNRYEFSDSELAWDYTEAKGNAEPR